LAKLFEALLLFYGSDCCADRDLTKVKIPNLSEADAQRVIGALLSAARDRNVRPEGDLALQKLAEAAPESLRPGLFQLAGFWKTKDAAAFLPALASNQSVKGPLRLAAIEGLRALGGNDSVTKLTELCAPEQSFGIRRAALGALAKLKLSAALAQVQPVMHDAPNENEALPAWRQLMSVQGGIDALKTKFDDAAWAKELPAPVLTSAIKAAREKGHAGALLAQSIEAAGGKPVASKNDMAAQIAGMVKSIQLGSDPGQGEFIYRRVGCVMCHSIGGAGGKLGPDLSSLGASAPLDYIVESVFDPAAKVKEGYHAFAYTMKDGSQLTGIPTRETATEQFIRPGPAPEMGLVKANIVKKELVGSLMPQGLTDALNPTEKRELFAFLSQIGRPGPFDASKGSILRLWRLYPGSQAAQAEHAEKIEEAVPAYTLVDGRLTRDLFNTALQLLPNAGDTVIATAQFQLATPGKTRFTLTGVSKAWLDGQPLAVASEPNPSPELSAGVHTFSVQVDPKALPETIRVEAEGANFLGN
jgi:putative heme-binding domain-containing protein